MPALLCFDTSTDAMSLALHTAQGEVLVHEAPGGPQASATLVPALLGLLAQAGTTLAELDAIAFGRGPGAFTGLRTACSVAQGLAFGAGKPVLPIDSLLIVAEDARTQLPACAQAEVWVAMDARMNEIYAAAYRWREGAWSVLQAPALLAPASLQALWEGRSMEAVAGSALEAFELHTAQAARVPKAASRARALATVALQAWARGEVVAAAQALPMYLRDKIAQTAVEREAARAAKQAAA